MANVGWWSICLRRLRNPDARSDVTSGSTYGEHLALPFYRPALRPMTGVLAILGMVDTSHDTAKARCPNRAPGTFTPLRNGHS